jgi:hypothetical protein
MPRLRANGRARTSIGCGVRFVGWEITLAAVTRILASNELTKH